MYWSEVYREYRQIMSTKKVHALYEEILDAVHVGYKTVNGKLRFLTDMQNYLWSLSENGGNPHYWDKLLNRAKSHGFNSELRALRREYLLEQHRRFQRDREGQQDYEHNIRREG